MADECTNCGKLGGGAVCGDCDGRAALEERLAKANERIAELEKQTWAVRVLDRYAVKVEAQAIAPCFMWFTSRVDGGQIPRWRIFYGTRAVGGHGGVFLTADAARIALAELLVGQDRLLDPRAHG